MRLAAPLLATLLALRRVVDTPRHGPTWPRPLGHFCWLRRPRPHWYLCGVGARTATVPAYRSAARHAARRRAPHESAASAHTDCRVSKSRLTAPCPHWNSAEAPGPTRPPGVVRCETPGADRRSPAARWPSTDQSPAPPPVSGRLDAFDTRA